MHGEIPAHIREELVSSKDFARVEKGSVIHTKFSTLAPG